MGAVLKGAHSSFAQIVKTTVFLKDLKDFDAVNKIYAKVCLFLSCIVTETVLTREGEFDKNKEENER